VTMTVVKGMTFRVLQADEVPELIDWAAAEGWNPGLNDGMLFHAVDPAGWFGAYAQGRLCGAAVATNYDDNFSFGGFYIVAPEYRRSGIGSELTAMAVDHAGERCFGIDGVLGMKEKYSSRMRMDAHYLNVRWQGTAPRTELPSGLIKAAEMEKGVLVDFDAEHFPVRREQFLKSWILQSDSTSLVDLDARGEVRGMGVLRRCREGHKIGPLFARNRDTAERLMDGLLHQIEGEQFFLDVPEPNREGMSMAEKRGLQAVFRTARMYSRDPPPVDISGVYGVTSFELG